MIVSLTELSLRLYCEQLWYLIVEIEPICCWKRLYQSQIKQSFIIFPSFHDFNGFLMKRIHLVNMSLLSYTNDTQRGREVVLYLIFILIAPASSEIIRTRCTYQGDFYRVMNNMILNKIPLETFHGKNVQECVQRCLRNMKCLSLNVETSNQNGAVVCELLNRDRTNVATASFIKKTNWTYYDSGFEKAKIGSQCKSNSTNPCFPCSCRDDCSDLGYSCFCKKINYFSIKHYGGHCLGQKSSEGPIFLPGKCKDLFHYKSGRILHLQSGKCLRPISNKPSSNIIFHAHCKLNEWTILPRDSVYFTIVHKDTNLCIYPISGTSNPSSSEELVLNSPCTSELTLFQKTTAENLDDRRTLQVLLTMDTALVRHQDATLLPFDDGADSNGNAIAQLKGGAQIYSMTERSGPVLYVLDTAQGALVGTFSSSCIRKPNLSDMTVSLWLMILDINRDMVILQSSDGSGTGISLAYNHEGRKISVSIYTGWLALTIAQRTEIKESRWYHIAYTYSRSCEDKKGRIKPYLDGHFIGGQIQSQSVQTPRGNGELYIGTGVPNSAISNRFAIDDLAIWCRYTTSEHIGDIYRLYQV